MDIKLNQQEIETLNDLFPNAGPERTAAEAKILARKKVNMERVDNNRSNFRVIVSKKGAVSVYGLGNRFPTTLYKEQWEQVFGGRETIEQVCATAPTRPSRKK